MAVFAEDVPVYSCMLEVWEMDAHRSLDQEELPLDLMQIRRK